MRQAFSHDLAAAVAKFDRDIDDLLALYADMTAKDYFAALMQHPTVRGKDGALSGLERRKPPRPSIEPDVQ